MRDGKIFAAILNVNGLKRKDFLIPLQSARGSLRHPLASLQDAEGSLKQRSHPAPEATASLAGLLSFCELAFQLFILLPKTEHFLILGSELEDFLILLPKTLNLFVFAPKFWQFLILLPEPIDLLFPFGQNSFIDLTSRAGL